METESATAAETPKRRKSYSLAQRVALVKKVKSKAKREGISIPQAAAQTGISWASYYRWASEGKVKRRVQRHAKNGGTADSNGAAGLIARLLGQTALETRLAALELEWAGFKRALGVKPEDLGQ